MCRAEVRSDDTVAPSGTVSPMLVSHRVMVETTRRMTSCLILLSAHVLLLRFDDFLVFINGHDRFKAPGSLLRLVAIVLK